MLEGAAQCGVIDIGFVEANAFVVTQQVRRGIGTHPVTGGRQDGGQQGNTGALAVGACHGDHHRRELHQPETGVHLRHALQAEFDLSGIQCLLPGQPLGDGVETHSYI